MTPASPNPPRRYDTLPTVSKGTSLQSFRVASDLWRQFAERTKLAGTNRSEVLRRFIAWYLREPDAELPERPEPPA